MKFAPDRNRHLTNDRKKLREMAMPEVRKLVKKYGRSAIYGCLVKISIGTDKK